MNENKQKITYTINWDSKEIWKKEVISKKFSKHLTESEVQELLKNKDTQIGIISERDVIEWVPKDENLILWNDKINHHICEKITQDDDDYFVGCEYEDFKGGYFYIASLWKMLEEKEELIILEHYH